MTAALGQQVTINGTPTLLAVPDLLPTYVPTTLNGVLTTALAYLVRGSITAIAGQTVTVDGKTTVLSTPTTVDGSGPQEVDDLQGGAAAMWTLTWGVILTCFGGFLIIWS